MDVCDFIDKQILNSVPNSISDRIILMGIVQQENNSICIYVYLSIYIYVYMYIYINIYISIYISIYIYIY